MPDWKKEIKFSDLFRRGERRPAEEPADRGAAHSGEGETPGWGAERPVEPPRVVDSPAGFESHGSEPPAVAPDPHAARGAAAGDDQAPVGAAAGGKAESVWKRDVRAGDVFRRRGRDGDSRPARGGLPDEPADAASSVWKRELKATELFRRREKAPGVPADALTRPGEEPGVKFWKKEVKLSELVRGPQGDPAGDEGMAQPEGRARRTPFGRPGTGRDGSRSKSKDAIPAPAPIPLLRSVNLLPADAVEEKSRKLTPGLVAAGVACVAVVAALGVTTMREGSTVTDLEAQKAQIEDQIVAAQQQAIPPVTSPTGEPLVAEQASRVTALSEALATRTAWDRVLRGTALVMPQGTWLKQVTGSSQPLDPAAPTGATVAALTLVGFSLEQEGVAQLLGRLRTLPEVSSVQLGAASLTEVGDTDVYEFSVTLALRSGVPIAQAPATGVPGLPTTPAAPPAAPPPTANQEQTP